MDKETVKKIADIVSDLKYYEWRKVVVAIEKKYSSALSRTQLKNAEELARSIEIEL